MKRILDSVHGYISIPKFYMNEIVDTPQFQRLRRIEQTSCRALFPSARHDRFIHSLGVFHVGSLIVDWLWEKGLQNEISNGDKLLDERKLSVLITYRLACLLHDVGHTPFSHTFEDYFINGANQLPQRLSSYIPEDKEFLSDFMSQFTKKDGKLRYAAHELISAIVALHYFKDAVILSDKNSYKSFSAKGNPSLLVRMIVGCKYLKEGYSYEDSFIELMHGDVIDADGVDYVCRDVWASGYSTAKVDLKRLIRSIVLYNYGNGNYQLCYDAKIINEIKSVLQIKAFQNDIIFNHHIIALEQHVLQEALKDAAIYHTQTRINEKDNFDNVRSDALKKLCNIDMYIGENGYKLEKGTIINQPMDDDFISIMKSTDPHEEQFISQWLQRKFKWCPLWKTREAFYADLPEKLRADINENEESTWIFSYLAKSCIERNFGIPSKEILILGTLDKDKLLEINKINVFVENKVFPYASIFPKVESRTLPYFKYIFIPISYKDRILDIRKCLIQNWDKALS